MRGGEAPPAAGLTLDELARELPGRVDIVGGARPRVVGVKHDSRAVAKGDLFVARRGSRADGAAFVADAVGRGAVAILAARAEGASIDAASAGVPVVLVDDVSAGLAYAAAAVYGHPAFALEVVGITGTNGKTTVAHLVRAAVEGAHGGPPTCGVIGTVGHEFGDLRLAAEHTTPEADELARVMAAMRARGATHVAMEVSSHALALGRVRAVRFRVAAFTNLTQDHLDFHASMEEYARAKARLFVEMDPGAGVVNVDDAFGRELATKVRAPLVRVSARGRPEADVAPIDLALDARGIQARVRTPAGEVDLASPLVGAHNVENLLVALGVAHALGLDLARAARGLSASPGAPGRLERCDSDEDDVRVFVDYAHTPDALARALDAVKTASKGRVRCVFGCGGDRDKAKRPLMGEAVAARADVAIVTNDNPRSEDPAVVAAEVTRGLERGGMRALAREELGRARGFTVELDRARAIDWAVRGASPGDVVLVAGKGHEDYQILGAEKRAFDDRDEARGALVRRRRDIQDAR